MFVSRKIAEERIGKLFELADRRMDEERPELADRYVELAKKIGMKYQVSLDSEQKRRVCGSCNRFLKPGVNCKVRINSKNNSINYHCNSCGEVNRHGY
jgi:ribonuclease P protein subunit RPR2